MPLTKPQRRRLVPYMRTDERANTFGTLNFAVLSAVALRWPEHYWCFHLMMIAVLLPLRFVRFRREKCEFYLLDWCYLVAYLFFICTLSAFVRTTFGVHTFLAPYNGILLRAGFAMSCGPLAMSILIFRNCLVFHSIDHMTSLFIHLSPCVLCWTLRWGGGYGAARVAGAWKGMFDVCPSYAPEHWLWDTSVCPASLAEFSVGPLLLYCALWSLPYFVVVLVILQPWLERTGRETLFTYFTTAQPGLAEALAALTRPLVGARLAPRVAYMGFHLVVQLCFCVASIVVWHSFVAHTAFIVVIVGVAVHNGSTYTFRVFATRYADELVDKHPHILAD